MWFGILYCNRIYQLKENMIYYSDSQKGFFDSDLHSIIPEDAIEIRKEDHFDLVEWASTSNQKLSVKDGKVIKDYDEEERKQNIKPGVDSIRDIRNYALVKSDIKVLPDYQITDEEREYVAKIAIKFLNKLSKG